MQASRDKTAGRAVTADAPHVPLLEKVAVGAGGLPQWLGNTLVQSVAQPFYVMILQLNPALLGVAIAVPRLWDAFTDPIMGRISDKWESRYGRRRPFIFIGAILMALSFGLIWMPSASWSQTTILAWFMATTFLFFTCYTVFAIPFTSLTYELTPNYDERTTVMGFTTFASKIGELSYQWIVPIAALGIFSSQLAGMRTVLWITAFVMLGLCGVLPALFARERYYGIESRKSAAHASLNLAQSARQTFHNKGFVVIIGLTLLQILSGMFGSSMDYYLLVYYMFDGDLLQGSTWKGVLSTGYAVCGILSIPLVIWFSKRTSKLTALRTAYVLSILNAIARWFIYQPGNEAWILLDPLLGCFLWTASGTVKQSMLADVCDEDEWRHGERREGIYGAVFGWITKTAFSLSALLGGIALVWVGFEPGLGGQQSGQTFLGMRLMMVLGMSVPHFCALLLLGGFPITREQACTTRTQLEKRRGKIST